MAIENARRHRTAQNHPVVAISRDPRPINSLSSWAFASRCLRKGNDRQPFSTRGRGQASVECGERHLLAGLAAQVQAAGELYRVSRAQRMPEEQSLGVGGQLRGQFHENPGGKIGVQPFQPTITLGRRERAFALAAGKSGGDLDSRQPARRDRPGLELPPDTGAAGLLDVALRQGTGVEVADQNRSSRSSPTASAMDAPRLRIDRNAGKASRVGSVTAPFVESLSSAGGNESLEASGRSSAMGSPRSVTTSVRPSRTRWRYVPRRVFSSREPTTFPAMWSL